MPFWRSGQITGETFLFIDTGDDQPTTCRMLALPRGPVVLAGAIDQVQFVEGVDYALDRDSGLLTRLAGSRLPHMTAAELHPSIDPDGSGFMHIRGNPQAFLFVDESGEFHKRQVTASYSFEPRQWNTYAPEFAGSDLRRSYERLQRHEPLTLSLLGDSISEGYSASGFIGLSPYQLPFGELVVEALRRAYRSPISFRNVSTAGWTSDDGLGAVDALAVEQPDLVLIAFGMNDAGYAEPSDYGSNIAAIVELVRKASPHTEFVLVSSMLPNPEWHYPRMERFEGYRRTLGELCRPGVVLADVTRIWMDVTARKSVYDLTGNGINHPNDFGHRLYAETVLSLLIQNGRR